MAGRWLLFPGAVAALCAAGSLALAQVAGAPDAAGPARETAPQIDAEDAGAMRILLARLESESPAEREKAESLLERIPLREKPDLEKWAQQQTGAEVHVRLLQRISEMTDELDLNPSLFEIRAKGGLSEIAAQLEKQTGAKFAAPDAAPLPAANEIYTLDGRKLTFCEALQALSEQHPLTFDPDSAEMKLLRANKDRSPMLLTRGALVCVGKVALEMQLVAGAGRIPVRTLSVPLGVQIDPGAVLISTRNLTVEAADSRTGTSLGSPTLAPQLAYRAARKGSWSREFLFADSNDRAQNVDIGGQLTLVVPAHGSQTLEVDPATQLNKPIKFGGALITLREFSRDPPEKDSVQQGVVLAFQIAGHGGALEAPPVPQGFGFAGGNYGDTPQFPMRAIQIAVVDAAGKQLHTSDENSGSAGSERDRIDADMKLPLKVTLSIVEAPHEVTVPFAFKDVPVKQ